MAVYGKDPQPPGPTAPAPSIPAGIITTSLQGIIKVSLQGIIKASLQGIIKASLGAHTAVGDQEQGAEHGTGRHAVVTVHCATRSAEKLIISVEQL